MKKIGYIYKLTLKEDIMNFKKNEVYIGKHNGRKEKYFSGGKIIKRILLKHSSEIFDREIICKDINSNELLCYLETYYIDLYKCNRSKHGTGLNLTDGGEGIFGFKKTKEQCENLSRAIKERYSLGLQKSPACKDVHQYEITTGAYIRSFSNCIEAAEFIGQPAKSNSSIAYSARENCKSAYGYMWSYRKMDIIDKIAGLENTVIQYDLKGNYINEYKNCAVAARANNFKSLSSIHNCALGRSKTSYKYLWKFKKDVTNE